MKKSIIDIKKEEEKKFWSYDCLIAHLEDVDAESEWFDTNAEDIRFKQAPDANPFVGFGGDEFGSIMLSWDSGWTEHPLRYTALNSILARAEINGNGIKRIFLANKDAFCDILNECFKVKENGRSSRFKSLLQNGKVSALHSAAYTEIPMASVFKTVNDFLSEFERVDFIDASWSWEATTVLYEIKDRMLEDVYRKLLEKHFGGSGSKISIQLFAISSDVAEAAVRFYPRFYFDSRVIPLNNGAAVKHIGNATVETVENQLYKVFASFEAACRNMAGLANIIIHNKKNAMIKAFSALNVPQKYAAELCNTYNNTPTNALDVYVSMCGVLTAMQAGGLTTSSILNYEEQLVRLITFNRQAWSNLDIPGEVAWSAKSK